MTQKEIFIEIAVAIKQIIPKNENFREAVLDIMRLDKVVEFTGYYINDDSNKKWLDIFNINLNTDYIHDLYIISQTQAPIHTNWNRAKYTLFPDAKMSIEYIWDQNLQDEIDRLNASNI